MKDLIRLKALLFGLQNDRIENSKQINDLQTELKTLLGTKETNYITPILADQQSQPVKLDIPALMARLKATELITFKINISLTRPLMIWPIKRP